MGFDLGHTISSLAKLVMRTQKEKDKNKTANAQNGESGAYKEFSTWLDWVLSSNSIGQAVAIHFNIYEDGRGQWSLELVGTSQFSANDSNWACAEIFATRSHPFKILHNGSWQEILALFKEYVKEYLETGLQREVLKCKEGVGIGFVDGDLEVVYQKVQTGRKPILTERNINKSEKNHPEIALYQLWSDHTYRAFETKEKGGYKAFCFVGEPVDDWSEVELFPSSHHTESGKGTGDVYPVEISAVVINEKCYRLIKPYIKDSVQVLQAKSKSEQLYVLNVTRVIDCLDKDNAVLKFFPSSGRIMKVEKYAFYKDMLKGAFIFKIPEEVYTHPYVTEEFKTIIEQNDIKGFKFIPVWKG